MGDHFAGMVCCLFTFTVVMPFRVMVFALIGMSGVFRLSGLVNVVFVCIKFNTKLSMFVFANFVGSVPISLRRTTVVSKYSVVRVCFGVIFPIVHPVVVAITVLGTV